MEGTIAKTGRELQHRDWIARVIGTSVEAGKAISLWRLPDAQVKNLIITNRVEVMKLHEISIEESKPGFLISPFSRSIDKYFLPADFHYVLDGEKLLNQNGSEMDIDSLPIVPMRPKFHLSSNKITKGLDHADFKNLVAKCVKDIEDGKFEKIVPSRSQLLELPEHTDLLEIFERLCDSYPHGFITLTSTPVTGTWIGASPELLVNIDRRSIFRTTALASTQAYQPGVDLKNISWNQKEIEEQALVSRYIINCFKKIRLREFEEHGPRTVRAGNLLHLKTDFSVDMRSTNFPQLGSVMLQLLHPTSAVCGMPLEPAYDFLFTHENYDRQLYTGFLGPVNINRESHLYVQLRCMQVNNNLATLYAGAGVTVDSNPELEWEETVMKMNTLQQIILT